jgi:hypothetical protein
MGGIDPEDGSQGDEDRKTSRSRTLSSLRPLSLGSSQ